MDINTLVSLLGKDNVITDPTQCEAYSHDYGRHRALPALVVFPQNTAHVVEIIRYCRHTRSPLTARGLGSGTPGGAVPVANGVVISFEKMRRILEINPVDHFIRVEPGVTNQEIQNAAAVHGLGWAPDPGSAAYCTVGGNLACNAGGPRTLKYGSARENTLGLRAVTGEAVEIVTGVSTTKGSLGYDLTRLLIGSEGTLALITEATLKLIPLPETSCTLRAAYTSVSAAIAAVHAIMRSPNVPCALEFLDHTALQALRRNASEIALPENAQALLLIDLDGPRSPINAIAAAVQISARNAGLIEIQQGDREILWAARKALSPALRSLASHKISEDIVVPLSQLDPLMQTLLQFSEKYKILIVSFGHIGNGNLHVSFFFDGNDPLIAQRAETCVQDLFAWVVEHQGTLTGEHGIGLEKRRFCMQALDPETLMLMKKIKSQFDPLNILNPGKIFERDSEHFG